MGLLWVRGREKKGREKKTYLLPQVGGKHSHSEGVIRYTLLGDVHKKKRGLRGRDFWCGLWFCFVCIFGIVLQAVKGGEGWPWRYCIVPLFVLIIGLGFANAWCLGLIC